MKVRNLLLMGSLFLIGGVTANAELVDGQRQKPVPNRIAGDLNYGEQVYLYNIGAQKFFLGANDWGTRASVSDEGFIVKFTQHLDENGAWDGKTVAFNDTIPSKKRWDLVNQAADGASWVDWASAKNANDTLWTITPVNGNYRLSVGEGNPTYLPDAYPDQYYGVKKEDASQNVPLLYWNLTTDAGYVDWYPVAKDEYAAFQTKLTVYNAAQNLYAELQNAKAKGIDVAAQQAVYENEDATLEQINAAIQAVKNAIASQATVDNPTDATANITNPSYDSNNNTGWSGTAPGFQTYTDAEHFNKTYDSWQMVKGLPKGVYAVSVQAFYRPGNNKDNILSAYNNGTSKNAQIYAIFGNDTITAPVKNIVADAIETAKGLSEWDYNIDGVTKYTPNNMQTAEEYFKDGLYNNTLFFAVENDSARIGIKKTVSVGNDWTIWDNWTLKYYGSGADAYTMWLNDMLKNVPDFSNLSEDVLVTTDMVDAYNAEKEQYTSASSQEEVMTIYKKLNADADSINTNIALWKQYQAQKDQFEKNIQDQFSGEDYNTLADYMENDFENNIADCVLTNDEIRAEIAKAQALMDAAVKNGISEGQDVTDTYLKNANFETTTGNNRGWISTHANGGNVNYGGNSQNHCFEAWNNANFDVYQEVKGAPVGVYTISVQGFYRLGRGDNAWSLYNDGTAANYKDAVKIYVNDNTASFKNVFDEKVPYGSWDKAELYNVRQTSNKAYITPDSAYWFPNNMDDGATAFRNGLYKATSYGVVAKDGDVLRIGVKGTTNQLNDSWAIWDDFKMVFQGTNAEVVKPLLEAKIAEVQDSVNSTARTMGTEVKSVANADLKDAQTALNGGDGKTMFNSLSTLISDQTTMNESAAAFDSLRTQTEALATAMMTYTDASAEAQAAASDLYDKVSAANNLTTAQARDYVKQISSAIMQLRLPANFKDATENNPVDVTTLITNPNYEKDGANSFEGWTQNPGSYNFGNDDTQKGALMIEYYHQNFNVNQTLTGLPNGKYRVQVSAFYRYGSAQGECDAVAKDPSLKAKAYLYGYNGTDSVKAPLALLTTGALTEDPSRSGQSQVTLNGQTVYLPNNMVNAQSWFNDGYYLNTVEVTVNNGTLTIGMEKTDNSTANDWVILDTWKLFYLGTPDPTGIRGITENGIGNVVATEVYNISGARQNGLQRGVNIVKFKDAEGKSVVKKIIVK